MERKVWIKAVERVAWRKQIYICGKYAISGGRVGGGIRPRLNPNRKEAPR